MGSNGRRGKWVQTPDPRQPHGGVVTPGSARSDPDWLGGSGRTLPPLLVGMRNYNMEIEYIGINITIIYLSMYIYICISICMSVCLHLT